MIIVTGSVGLIGSEIVRFFAKQGLEDPEKQVDYVAPLDGQGGFGNDINVNRTSPLSGETISTIIQRY